jgi:cyclopropane fatty-acyl-phospholipid synthase-like methyltransferase
MFKRLLSFFIPVSVYRAKSTISKQLEVNWNNGQLVLDSSHTNYSFGSLQRILRHGLKQIGFDKIAAMQHILVLGVGGGSVLKTLVNEVHYRGKITGVELDPEVIQLGYDYFQLRDIHQLNLIQGDAFDYVLKTAFTFDLIIVDVFQDTKMPNFLFEKFFVDRLGMLLKSPGYILFNTMTLTKEDLERNTNYCVNFNNKPFKIKRLPKIEDHNELLIIEKNTN